VLRAQIADHDLVAENDLAMEPGDLWIGEDQIRDASSSDSSPLLDLPLQPSIRTVHHLEPNASPLEPTSAPRGDGLAMIFELTHGRPNRRDPHRADTSALAR